MQPIYPIGPKNIDKTFFKVSGSYKFKVALAIFSIALFFILYVALVLFVAWLVYLSIFYEISDINKFTILMKLGSIAGSVMLFFFTVKFIIKLKNPKHPNRIKLNEKDHPVLINFIHQICRDTYAPKPKSIFLDPDVNAYVSYSNLWLSLIMPVKKDLTIGLGLVDALNLSEFKAVVAHEFGHFSQRSMKIGSYIVSANTIIYDMIFSRDKWDEILDQWRKTDLRLAFFAWIITPIIWIIRQILRLFYLLLNVMYSSLSREMEFNADKVAVSVTGSMSIVTSLWKLDFGSQSWDHLMYNTYHTSQKEIYTKNLYLHNRAALNKMSAEKTKALLSLPEDELGGKKYFTVSEHSKVSMYASHPENDQREKNAKQPFILCEIDERDSWLLFNNPSSIQEQMTALVYDQYFKVKPERFVDFNEFEKFIELESTGKELMNEFLNTFENRFIYVPTTIEIKENNNRSKTLEELKEELKNLMAPVKEIENSLLTIQQISNGTHKSKSFIYDGIEYKKSELEKVYNKLMQKREDLFLTNFKSWDIDFCLAVLQLAKNHGDHDDMLRLFLQHGLLSEFYRTLIDSKNEIYKELSRLQSESEVTLEELKIFSEDIMRKISSLNTLLDKFNEQSFIALPNIENITDFKNSIIKNGKFPTYQGNLFGSDGKFDSVAENLENAVQHCQRLDQKSIGYILFKNAQYKN